MGRSSDIISRFPLLPEYLRRWCQGDTSEVVIRYLLRVAASLAKRFAWRRISAAAHHDETGADQMAISVASTIFIKPNPCSPLCEALRPCTEDDAKLVARFLSYTITAIKNESYARWQTTDPTSYKLWDRLKGALKLGPYHCWPQPESIWVKQANTVNLNVNGLPWDEQELMRIACDCSASTHTDMPTMVRAILTKISEAENRQRFVEIDSLFEAIRLATGMLLETESPGDFQAPFLDPAMRQRLVNEIGKAGDLSREYLKRYSRRDKLGENGLTLLHQALDSYVDDVRVHGAPRLSQQEYVNEQWPEMTDEIYKRHLKSAFQGAVAYFWQQLRGIQ